MTDEMIYIIGLITAGAGVLGAVAALFIFRLRRSELSRVFDEEYGKELKNKGNTETR